MNKAFRDYQYNGWNLRASEMHNDWDLTPMYNDAILEETFQNNEVVTFRTLSDAKKWVKSDEAHRLKKKYIRGDINE